jgi:hypothetical protein
VSISLEELIKFVGLGMEDICPNSFTTSDQNHCAHFVSHVLKQTIGLLCGSMKHETRGTGVSVRCNELYNGLEQRGAWDSRPAFDNGIFIFVTDKQNVVNDTMINVPKKHVGIHHSGQVFHFSNGQHKVIRDPTVEAFHSKFRRSYAGKNISLFYGIPLNYCPIK